MIVIEREYLTKASEIAKRMGVSFSYQSFVWEGETVYELRSSSKALLAVIKKELYNNSQVLKYFENL